MSKSKLKQFTNSGRPFGLFLAASGMFIVSTDSLFTRVAEIDGWTIAFFVGLFLYVLFLRVSSIRFKSKL